MPFTAELPPNAAGAGWAPEMIAEQPALQTEEGLAFEERIRRARGALLDVGRPGTVCLVIPHAAVALGTEASQTSYTIGPKKTAPAQSWVDFALQLFHSSRNMTADESAEYETMRNANIKPLSKPVRKHRLK